VSAGAGGGSPSGPPGGGAPDLDRLAVTVPDHALEPFAAAFEAHCQSVGFFRDEATGDWCIEAIRRPGDPGDLQTALLLAAAASGIAPPALSRTPTRSGGWLAQVAASFPPQRIGRRWLVVGTHDASVRAWGRLRIVLDAGLAFGSGEHGSTRGCLRALEGLCRPRGRILDLGTGSGILAIAAAQRFRRAVLATDIEAPSVRVAAANARANGVANLVHPAREDGVARRVRSGAPYGLVLANILARPLCAMARGLAPLLAPGARVVLAGLLDGQANQVAAAWRRQGIVAERRLRENRWTTLVLRAPREAERRPPVMRPGTAA
jgi:ribosomal protein L11 methyltransferase